MPPHVAASFREVIKLQWRYSQGTCQFTKNYGNPRATKEPISGMSLHTLKTNINFHYNSEINKHIKGK